MRTLVASAALLSIATVLGGIAALPGLQARFARPVLYYDNLPLPTARPGPFRPGEVVPVVVSRCLDDPSVAAAGGRVGYDLSRALVADDEATSAALGASDASGVEPGPPARQVLPPTFADSGNGCDQMVSTRNVLPARVPPGTYFFEGVARYIGPTGRTGSAYWRTQTFVVVP
jgi:hypothetical protein